MYVQTTWDMYPYTGTTWKESVFRDWIEERDEVGEEEEEERRKNVIPMRMPRMRAWRKWPMSSG